MPTYTVNIPDNLNAGIVAIGYAESTLEVPVNPEDVVQRYALAAAEKACQDMHVGPYYQGPIPPQFNADGTPYAPPQPASTPEPEPATPELDGGGV